MMIFALVQHDKVVINYKSLKYFSTYKILSMK